MRKHLAQVSQIFPTNTEIEQLVGQKAYCGLSLSNPNYSSDRLKAVVRFLIDNFSHSILLTTGYLYRYHYQMLGCSKDDAISQALESEQKYINSELNPTLDVLDESHKLEVVSWSDLFDLDDFKSTSQVEVVNFYNSNKQFKLEIDNVAASFVDAKLASQNFKISCSSEKAKQLSINFLLEESAIFDYLGRKGYMVDVYPGIALPALRNMKRYSDPPSGLKERIAVEIVIKRSGRKKKVAQIYP